MSRCRDINTGAWVDVPLGADGEYARVEFRPWVAVDCQPADRREGSHPDGSPRGSWFLADA